MTADAAIIIARAENVLLLPRTTVRAEQRAPGMRIVVSLPRSEYSYNF